MKRLIISILAAVTIAVLVSCGGGNSSTSEQRPSIPSASPRADLLYGYFGTGPGQLAETAAHINLVHVDDWGDWDTMRESIRSRQIGVLQEAQARGVPFVMLSTGYLMFDDHHRYLGIDAVRAYKAQLDQLQLTRNIVALYPVDEPDMNGFDDATMQRAYTDLKTVWPGAKVAVIYGDHGNPGIVAADWIGHDAYELGAGVLDHMPMIRPDQHYIIVPGGASPWRADPSPFKAFADAHANVAVIMPFLWIDGWGGTANPGIRSNGMAPAYTKLGDAIRNPRA